MVPIAALYAQVSNPRRKLKPDPGAAPHFLTIHCVR